MSKKLIKPPMMLLIGLTLGSCATAISATDLIDRGQLCNSLQFVQTFKPSRSDTPETVEHVVRLKAFFFDDKKGFCR